MDKKLILKRIILHTSMYIFACYMGLFAYSTLYCCKCFAKYSCKTERKNKEDKRKYQECLPFLSFRQQQRMLFLKDDNFQMSLCLKYRSFVDVTNFSVKTEDLRKNILIVEYGNWETAVNTCSSLNVINILLLIVML